MRKILLAVCLVAAGCHHAPPAIPEILGQVNDEYLTTDEFMHHLKLRGGLDLEGYSRHAMKRFLLAELVNRKLLLQEVRRQRIRPSRHDVRASFAEQGGPAWEKPERDRAGIVFDEVYEHRQIERLLRELLPTPDAIANDEADRYLAAHPALLERPEEFRLRQVVVHSATMAEQLAIRMRDGDALGDLARRSAERVTGPAWAGEADLPPPLWATLGTARDGRLTGPVASESGWHFAVISGRRRGGPGSHTAGRAVARAHLRRERHQAATERLIAGLRRHALIRVDMAAVEAL